VCLGSGCPTRREVHDGAAVLINVFEVPEGRDEEFRAGWRAAADYLRHQPGFISTRLHASLDPTAEFRYVNVAVW
jgi:heme oxygenase (mycobilin-producing)